MKFKIRFARFAAKFKNARRVHVCALQRGTDFVLRKKRAEILSLNFKLKYESCVFFIAYRAYSFKRFAFGQALKFSANLAGFCGF